jgi:hypothetical protein
MKVIPSVTANSVLSYRFQLLSSEVTLLSFCSNRHRRVREVNIHQTDENHPWVRVLG